uniref:Uncharacterized protein n=1 Tax=Candidozyma auris TaxID=498019 RepID=A0A0L0NQV9_CANAR
MTGALDFFSYVKKIGDDSKRQIIQKKKEFSDFNEMSLANRIDWSSWNLRYYRSVQSFFSS